MISDFVSLLFPHCCVVSGEPLAKGEQLISTGFAAALPRFDLHTPNEKFAQKFSGLVCVEHTLAYYKFRKKSGVQKLLHCLKYKNYPEVGEIAGRWFGEALSRAGYHQHFDLIVPVPLHASKKRKRGYNQSDHIAMGMSVALGVPWSDQVLIRTAERESQTRKGRAERFGNSDNIYQITHSEQVLDKNILLIDDVITTGATIISCALLFEGIAKTISVAALASAE